MTTRLAVVRKTTEQRRGCLQYPTLIEDSKSARRLGRFVKQARNTKGNKKHVTKSFEEAMKTVRMGPDTYQTAIEFYSQAQSSKAQSVFNKMRQSGYKATREHWTSLLKAYKNERDLEGALSCLKQMEHAGHAPDGHVYALLLSVAKRDANLLRKITNVMRSNGVELNMRHHNTILSSFTLLADVEQYLVKHRLFPDTVTYTIMARHVGNSGMLPLRDAMARRNIVPTIQWYEAAFTAMCKEPVAVFTELEALYIAMRQDKVPLTACVYSLYIRGASHSTNSVILTVMESLFSEALVQHRDCELLYDAMLCHYAALRNRGAARRLRSKLTYAGLEPSHRFLELYSGLNCG